MVGGGASGKSGKSHSSLTAGGYRLMDSPAVYVYTAMCVCTHTAMCVCAHTHRNSYEFASYSICF